MPTALLDLNGHVGAVPTVCGVHIEKWRGYFARIDRDDVALLAIPCGGLNYIDVVRPKTRNMLRKAENNGYTYNSYNYNDYLKDMERVNKSTSFRQDRPMAPAYREHLNPIGEVTNTCTLHAQVYIGGFKDEHLLAYAWLLICNDVAILNRIIGHADHLAVGVMNGLIKALVDYCQTCPSVKYLNYLNMASASGTLTGFKQRVGFESYQVKVVS